MTTTPEVPIGAIRLSRYQELDQLAQTFAAGQLNLLFLIGPPGVQKSRIMQSAVGNSVAWIQGNLTAFGLYQELYRKRNKLVVLDDIDGLFRDPTAVRILKCICQTEPVKHVAWYSDAASLRREDIPRSFSTSSKIAIIANEFKAFNVNVRAVQDRGHMVIFDPEPQEIHTRAGTWFWDQEVFDFIGRHLHYPAQLSLRDYYLGWELKAAGLDWRNWLLEKWGLTGTCLLVARLKGDPSYAREADRVQAFIDLGGGCRTTYFNHAKKLPAWVDLPDITLTGLAPRVFPSSDGFWDALQRRHKHLGEG